MGTLLPVGKSHPQLSPEQVRRLGRLGMATSTLAAASAGGSLTGQAIATVRNERKATRKTSKQRGHAEIKKAEDHLEEVAKSSYMRRTPNDPGSELDLIAAAKLLLEAEHKTSKLPWRRQRQLRDQLNAAIARGYLNAPYTRST